MSNLQYFRQWHIVPQMLRNVALSDFTSPTRLFGKEYPTPIVIAPIGVQAQLNKEHADCATAAAASELNIPFTLSSATSRPMEQVYEAGAFKENDSDAWFQLYWPLDDDITASLLKRAKSTGYSVLVVTLDTWQLGWRPRDLDTGKSTSRRVLRQITKLEFATAYNPFLTGEGVANVFTDPVFVEKYCDGKVGSEAILPTARQIRES